MTLKEFKMDLHVHTCLSPCAEPEMVPTAIIKRAKHQNLDTIAICDHNCAENVPAVRKAGQKQGINVIGGMEICSSEEAHILTFFDDDDALFEMQNIVHENLPGVNDENYFGRQLIVDENDKVVSSCKKLLIDSTSLGVDKIVQFAHKLGGLAVASHIDRAVFGIIAQLGFIPENLPLDALEISSACGSADLEKYRNYNLPLITSSDSHVLADIGTVFTTYLLKAPVFSELAMAFRGIKSRAVNI